MFDVGIFLAAMGITLLEMAEASAVGIVLATESRNAAPYLAAAAGVITILIPTALAGQYIQLLPILYVRLASAILLLYFGLRLVKSARRSFEMPDAEMVLPGEYSSDMIIGLFIDSSTVLNLTFIIA